LQGIVSSLWQEHEFGIMFVRGCGDGSTLVGAERS
jgi:hypothetical protein